MTVMMNDMKMIIMTNRMIMTEMMIRYLMIIMMTGMMIMMKMRMRITRIRKNIIPGNKAEVRAEKERERSFLF